MIDLAPLERAFDDALEAVIPNPVALIFSDLPLGFQGKRDLVFAMGLLREGENECALIAGFIAERLAAEPAAAIDHLEREAWYYLRTSIDPTWQFDEGGPTMTAALAYLQHVLELRTEHARMLPKAPDEPNPPAGAVALLEGFRAESASSMKVLP